MIVECQACNERLIRQWRIGEWVWEHLHGYSHEPVPVFMGYETRMNGELNGTS